MKKNFVPEKVHKSLAIALGIGLVSFAIWPVTSQDTAPAEPFSTDYAPYTLGRADTSIAKSFETPMRVEKVKFEVGGLMVNYGQTEYKVTMKPGDTLMYSWVATDDLYYEFHGHTRLPDGTPGDAMLYRDEKGKQSSGVITAALDGIHGWYFLNDSFDETIEVELTLAGNFELTPGIINTR